MTEAEGRDRWTLRYGDAKGEDKAASTWLLDAASTLPPDATIVDLAGGFAVVARRRVPEQRPVRSGYPNRRYS